MIPVEDRVGLPAEALAAIAALVQSHRGLDDVARHSRIAGSVIQDEFSHDILVPHGDALWLVYDAT